MRHSWPEGTRSHLARLGALALLIGLLPVVGSAASAAATQPFTQMDAGNSHTCAVTSAGGAECWGANGFGQLGIGSPDTDPHATPLSVSGLSSGVEQVALGSFSSCALMDDGTVKCRGTDEEGNLGNGDPRTDSATPVDVTGITDAVQIDSGADHVCAVIGDGTLDCWGYGNFGQLGDVYSAPGRPPEDHYATEPSPVSGITDAIQVATGVEHTCVLHSTGAVECWGLNDYGQLGNGEEPGTGTAYNGGESNPVPVMGLSSGVDAIAAGYENTCASVGSRWSAGEGTRTDRSATVGGASTPPRRTR